MPRGKCFVCDLEFPVRNLARLLLDENNIEKREVAIQRRNEKELPPAQINDHSRICLNCNRSITNEIRLTAEDPGCMRLNVLTQTNSNSCLICDASDEQQLLSLEARVMVFIKRNIYVPVKVRTCKHHTDENGLLPEILLATLRSINRPYVIRGEELQHFLQGLRSAANTGRDFGDIHAYTEEEFKCLTSLRKDQFNDLRMYCDPVATSTPGSSRHVYVKNLLAFLCKMRQGLSDELLKVMFSYTSRQAVSLAIATVRKSLLVRFVPENIGFGAITRDEYIERHVTDFANQVYNPTPAAKIAIAIVDGTYAYINKSTNFRALRQSYCVHKGRHLVKPKLFVAPDGYILAVQGPYFSDSKNNDAKMLIDLMEKDIDGIRSWFLDGDTLLVDRGYRDAVDFLLRLGIKVAMPSLLLPREKQLSTEEANKSRIVTKNRWIVETRNGHFRSMYKFFKSVIEMNHATNLNDFYSICGALINRYHPLVPMLDANNEFAQRMLARLTEPNIVQARVEVDNLIRKRAIWAKLVERDLSTFPRLSLEYIRSITFGPYQIRLAASYVQEKVHHQEQEEFQLDQLTTETGFIRIRLYSRYRNNTKHDLFISFVPQPREEIDNPEEEPADEPILGYYCTCQSGARTLGTCAHVASVLWYLGYARHEQNVHYPPTSLVASVSDAGSRVRQNNVIRVAADHH